jgi:hypothetical protein
MPSAGLAVAQSTQDQCGIREHATIEATLASMDRPGNEQTRRTLHLCKLSRSTALPV